MSVSALTTQQASLHRWVNAQALAEGFQSSDLHVWLSTLSLPITALLEFHCCPTALWSDDRSQCVFNRAATALLGVPASDIRAGKDVWLDCVDPRDREQFVSAWQSLQSGAAKVVCSYRFIPPAAASPIDLEETALRLAASSTGQPVVLSWYQVRQARDGRGRESMRGLVHQIGNSLQSVRGEVDLFRLYGALPQESFDTIVQGIENIRELTARLVDTDRVTATRAGNGNAVSGNSDGQRCAEEVRRGRT